MRKPIDHDRLAQFVRTELRVLESIGEGYDANGGIDMSIMQAVDWLTRGSIRSETHECIDPVIRRFCTKLNDWADFKKWHDEFKPFTQKIVGTYVDDALMCVRACMCADWTIRHIAPMAFGFHADLLATRQPATPEKLLGWAQRLRDAPPIVDRPSARTGYSVASAVYAEAASAYTDDRDVRTAYMTCAACANYAANAAFDAAGAFAAYATSVTYASHEATVALATASATSSISAINASSVHAEWRCVQKYAAFQRALWDDSLQLLQRLIDAQVRCP
jgi:hypothetical protein